MDEELAEAQNVVAAAYANMAVMYEPLHEFVQGQRNKFVAEGWGEPAAEHMAMGVFFHMLAKMP